MSNVSLFNQQSVFVLSDQEKNSINDQQSKVVRSFIKTMESFVIKHLRNCSETEFTLPKQKRDKTYYKDQCFLTEYYFNKKSKDLDNYDKSIMKQYLVNGDILQYFSSENEGLKEEKFENIILKLNNEEITQNMLRNCCIRRRSSEFNNIRQSNDRTADDTFSNQQQNWSRRTIAGPT